jgi:hypothetical protein
MAWRSFGWSDPSPRHRPHCDTSPVLAVMAGGRPILRAKRHATGVPATPRGETALRSSWCGAPKRESVARRKPCGTSTGVRGTPRGVRGFNGSPWHVEDVQGSEQKSEARREVCGTSTGAHSRRKARRASMGVRGTPRGGRDFNGSLGTSKGVQGLQWESVARRKACGAPNGSPSHVERRVRYLEDRSPPCRRRFEDRGWRCVEQACLQVFESRWRWCAQRRADAAGAVLTPVYHESG